MEQFSIEHQRVRSLGEVVTLQMKITEFVQISDVQLVTLNAVVEILNKCHLSQL